MNLLSDPGSLLIEDTRMENVFDFEKIIDPFADRGSNVEVEVCKDYIRGQCYKGTNCPYRHVRSDKAVVCKHWLRGLCKKGDNCEFLHEYDLSRMPICFFYSKYGECSNPDCIYRHIATDDGVKECPWYARGFCKHGPNCRNKHTRRIPCENYLVGFCPEGPNCKFGHPKFELPKEQPEDDRAMKLQMMGVRITCHKCGQSGHKANNCPNEPEVPPPQPARPPGKPAAQGQGAPGLRPLETVTCFKCGQLGHYANKCPNRGIPGLPRPKMAPQQYGQQGGYFPPQAFAPVGQGIPTIE